MASIQDILRPITITKIVSRIAASTGSFLNFMGMQPDGPLVRPVGGREASYHIFDNVRTTAAGRAPGMPAARRARNPAGKVPFTFPRMHEEVYLLSEEINNFAKFGTATRDQMGADYVRRQMKPPAQRAGNWRTAMVVGMLRDSLYAHASGDDWYFDYTSGTNAFQINYQMPSGNKNQLNMLGTGNIIDVPWNNSSANIPLHITNYNAALLQLTGMRLEHIVLTGAMWNNVITNDYVVGMAGLVNTPFTKYARKVGEGPDGTPINEFIGEVAAIPGVMFHITDDGIELGLPESATWTKHVGDNNAMFLPTPSADWTELLLGSEPIREYDNGPEDEKMGLASWTKGSSNPTGIEVFTLDNALPVNYVPKCTAYPTLIF